MFSAEEREPENLFDVLFEFTPFFRKHAGTMKRDAMSVLFEYIEECVVTDFHDSGGISLAVRNHFLDNIVGNPEMDELIAPFLVKRSRIVVDEMSSKHIR